MKIFSINNIKSHTFKADTDTKDPLTGEYKDPLMHWPLRGAAFTNEVGEALRPLIGKYATLSWVPALLYIGADIYDKYKNDQTEYSPNSNRALKQAIFQGMASIFLPLVAVKAGQNIFSLFGYATKERLTINTKEQVDKLAQAFVANGNMSAYKDNELECINKFKDIVKNNIDYKKNRYTDKNSFIRLICRIESKILKKIVEGKQKNLDSYAQETIIELITKRKNLLSPSKEVLLSKEYTDYKQLLDKGQTKSVAVKSVLNKAIEKKSLNGKFIKTLGGFLALGFAIAPIDHFVEHILIGKVVNQTLENKKKTH